MTSSTAPSLPTSDLVTEYKSTESFRPKDSIEQVEVSTKISIEKPSTETVQTFDNRVPTQENIKQNESKLYR